MITTTIFSHKADYYSKYRWRYVPEAIDYIVGVTGLNRDACIADIGSGTGILTEQLVERAKKVYAVEPNPHMRDKAEDRLGGHPAFQSVFGKGESTTLPSESVDLITAAHSLHWMDFEQTKREFRRILKPQGWLACINNVNLENEFLEACQQALDGTSFDFSPKQVRLQDFRPEEYFLSCQKVGFPFKIWHTLETWVGASLSIAFSPGYFDAAFREYLEAVSDVFYQFAHDDRVEINGITEVRVGRLAA